MQEPLPFSYDVRSLTCRFGVGSAIVEMPLCKVLAVIADQQLEGTMELSFQEPGQSGHTHLFSEAALGLFLTRGCN